MMEPLPLGLIVQIGSQKPVVGLVVKVVPVDPASRRFAVVPDGVEYQIRLFRDWGRARPSSCESRYRSGSQADRPTP